MKKYRILFKPEAKIDMDTLYFYIADELMSPKTADNYIDGIIEKIELLMFTAEIYAINPREYIQRLYGPGARTIIYKKMTIIYNVERENVMIRRIIPSSMVF